MTARDRAAPSPTDSPADSHWSLAENDLLAISPAESILIADLYQFTMAACYANAGCESARASFEVFVRHLPAGFGYLVAMGLGQAIAYLNAFQFSSAHIAALQGTGIFDRAGDRFWQLLADARFTGDVWAMPEGTVAFASEPLLRIEAPLWQAQIVETYLLNAINYQTLIATRAARLRDVAGDGAVLLEFGTRRAFSPQASLWAARAALAAGMDATSNVLAALKLGRKPAGTMAHALVMALAAKEGSEMEAFEAFHRVFPGSPLLVDTFDTVAAVRSLAQRSQAGDFALQGVRLDSGDLATLSQEVRSLLPEVPILASGDLDEHEILRLQRAGACLDGYGIGTKLVTGAPVNGVYKLVEIDGTPTCKRSPAKQTYPGRKQVFRRLTEGGIADRLALADELPAPDETPLLVPVMANGQVIRPADTLDAIAARVRAGVRSLPPEVRCVEDPHPLMPTLSPKLAALTECLAGLPMPVGGSRS